MYVIVAKNTYIDFYEIENHNNKRKRNIEFDDQHEPNQKKLKSISISEI